MEVVMHARFGVVILPREPQVHGDAALALQDARRPEGFRLGFPARVAFLRGCQLRRAQMIRVQVVVAGLGVCQAGVVDIGLPDRISAP